MTVDLSGLSKQVLKKQTEVLTLTVENKVQRHGFRQ